MFLPQTKALRLSMLNALRPWLVRAQEALPYIKEDQILLGKKSRYSSQTRFRALLSNLYSSL